MLSVTMHVWYAYSVCVTGLLSEITAEVQIEPSAQKENPWR